MNLDQPPLSPNLGGLVILGDTPRAPARRASGLLDRIVFAGISFDFSAGLGYAFYGNRIVPGALNRENREAGVNPARTRHCKWGVPRHNATVLKREGAGVTLIHKSGDLPG